MCCCCVVRLSLFLLFDVAVEFARCWCCVCCLVFSLLSVFGVVAFVEFDAVVCCC